MQKLWQEFKAFALKGNMIDLAIAVIIGGAFGAVVQSLVKNVMMPILSYLPGLPAGYETWQIGQIKIGLFLSDIINFLIVALAMFIMVVKILGALVKKATAPDELAEPTTKECPYCLSTIAFKATRCAHCTSDLNGASSGVIRV